MRTSQYRCALDTAALALPDLPNEVTALLSEQHYSAATCMTSRELYAATALSPHPICLTDRPKCQQ